MLMISVATILLQSASPEVAPPKLSAKPALIGDWSKVDISAARALGHHGQVVIKGSVGVDGRVADPVVAVSSGSPLLDAAALSQVKAAALTPARDVDGKPVAVPVTFPFQYIGDGASPEGNLGRYRCGQFSKDMAWWHSAHPGRPVKEHQLYLMLTGVKVMAHPGGLVEGLGAGGFEADWNKATAQCAKQPDTLLIDHLPTRKVIMRLINAGQL